MQILTNSNRRGNMSGITELLELIEEDRIKLDQIMSTDIDELAKSHDSQLIDILRFGLLGGGKRFRPLLALVSSRLVGRPGEEIYSLAIAFEYLHAATLFHDDVIDQAEQRRGKPSIYAKYGVEAAILAGDFLHARAMEIIGSLGGIDCLKVFCRATTAMVDGEFLQLANARNYNQSEEDYYRTIEGKTALLISAATEIGAIHGGGDNGTREALRQYGRNLGFGFQIVDDLLDYQGNTKKTGKAIGNDLDEGKMTLPLIIAMEHADPEDKTLLLEILQKKKLRRQSFQQVCELIEKCDGFAKTRRKAEEFIATALIHLDVFQEKSRDLKILKGLAQYVLSRDK